MQVILVGHDFGGTCISYAMEAFSCKIAKAVFVSAAMLTNGQNTLDMFSEEVCFLLHYYLEKSELILIGRELMHLIGFCLMVHAYFFLHTLF